LAVDRMPGRPTPFYTRLCPEGFVRLPTVQHLLRCVKEPHSRDTGVQPMDRDSPCRLVGWEASPVSRGSFVALGWLLASAAESPCHATRGANNDPAGQSDLMRPRCQRWTAGEPAAGGWVSVDIPSSRSPALLMLVVGAGCRCRPAVSLRRAGWLLPNMGGQ
jgi:hypothetical protein